MIVDISKSPKARDGRVRFTRMLAKVPTVADSSITVAAVFALLYIGRLIA